jgi:hypothetical protein
VTVFSASPALVVRGRSSATSSLLFEGISTLKLTGGLDLKALAIDALAVHSIDGIPGRMIIIIFLKRLASCAYNEGVFALDGYIADLPILGEGLLKVLGAGALAQPSDVNLGVLG